MLKGNIISQLVVIVVTTKSIIVYINCGKTWHSIETCHNWKKEILIIPIVTIMSIEPKAWTKTHVKPIRIPI